MYEDSLNIRHALPPSICLKHTYLTEDVLGEGGFGITYSGKNKATGKHVAIKEYFPSGLAVRIEQEDAFFVRPVSPKNEEPFLRGRKRFLNEAKVLKEFQYLDSIVSVYDVFEENNTAYIVMDYIEGPTLKQYIDENGCLCFTELLSLMAPVILALSIVHKKKLIHRDISPDNLILGMDNHLHLIDFGAASQENTAGGKHTVILKAGYAPPEQYIPDSKTGAWIDVYALCATMYFALTGNPPFEAIHRLEEDSLEFPDIPDLLPWQKAALEKGLHIHMSKRFRSMEEFYDAITTAPEPETQVTVTGIPLTKKEKQKIRQIRYRLKIPLFISLLLFLMAFISFIIPAVKSHPMPTESPALETASPQASSIPPKASALTAPLSMPKLSGLPLKQAKQVLKKLDDNIYIETSKEYNSSIKKGRVISQSVVDGTLFSQGQISTILLTVSRGKKPKPSASPRKDTKPKTTETPKTTPKSQVTPQPKATQKPEKSTKKPSSDYHVTPEDDDFVTIPFD